MKGTTHFIAGAAAAALIYPKPEFVLTAGIAALLPDIDHPSSKISQLATFGHMRSVLSVVFFVTGIYYRIPYLPAFGALLFAVSMLPHRGITHSLLALVGVLIFAPTAVFIGYLTHILLDMASGSVPIFWPHRKRFGLRLAHTNGLVDTLLGLFCLIVTLLKL